MSQCDILSDLYLSDSEASEGYEQLEVPEQPHSPFMMDDDIDIDLCFYILSVLSTVFRELMNDKRGGSPRSLRGFISFLSRT